MLHTTDERQRNRETSSSVNLWWYIVTKDATTIVTRMLPNVLNWWCLWIMTSFTERFTPCVTLPSPIRGRQWGVLQSMCCKSHTRARRCHSKAWFQCVSWHKAAGVMLMQLPSNPTDCAFGTLPHYWKYIFCDKALFILTPHPIVTLLAVKSHLWRSLKISRPCVRLIAWFCRVQAPCD